MDYDFDATLPALRLVPRVFDDELLASYWNRVTALHCFNSKRVTTSMAWEERWRNVGVRLPTNVLAFWTRAGHRVLPTAQDWLFLHTMFPVYACALPIDRQRSLSSKLMLGGNGPVVPSLSLLASDRQRFSVLVCSRCEEEDIERWGTSVWRRSHNSPGVSVCLDHSRPLERLLLRSDPPRRLPVLQAGDEIGLSDIRLAKAYVDLLQLTPAELLAFATNLRARANAFLGRAPESAVNSGRVGDECGAKLVGADRNDRYAALFHDVAKELKNDAGVVFELVNVLDDQDANEVDRNGLLNFDKKVIAIPSNIQSAVVRHVQLLIQMLKQCIRGSSQSAFALDS